jgi:hypothetical protein
MRSHNDGALFFPRTVSNTASNDASSNSSDTFFQSYSNSILDLSSLEVHIHEDEVQTRVFAEDYICNTTLSSKWDAANKSSAIEEDSRSNWKTKMFCGRKEKQEQSIINRNRSIMTFISGIFHNGRQQRDKALDHELERDEIESANETEASEENDNECNDDVYARFCGYLEMEDNFCR